MDGTINFAPEDTVTLDVDPFNGSTQIIVNGTLNATGTVFNRTGGRVARLTVNSGGRLVAASNTFALTRLTLNIGAVVNASDLSNNAFDRPSSYRPALFRCFPPQRAGATTSDFRTSTFWQAL